MILVDLEDLEDCLVEMEPLLHGSGQESLPEHLLTAVVWQLEHSQH